MKQKIKNYLKLGSFLFGIIVILTNCENDENVKPLINNKSPFELIIKNYHDLKLEPRFKNAIDNITTVKKNSKTVMENQYEFTIDSTTVNKIRTKDNISYTLLIHRETEDNSFFENLVVIIDSTNIPKTVIVKYTLNSSGIYNPEDDSYSLDAQIEVTPITYDASLSKIGDCVGILMCPWGESHTAGQKCIDADRDGEDAIYLDDSICEGGGSGLGGNDSNGGVSSSPDGGATSTQTGGSGGTIITSPISTQPPKTPCEKLNDLTDNANIRNKVKILKEHSNTNSEKEKGFKVLKNPSNDNLRDQPIKTGIFNGVDYKIDIKAGPYTVMVNHTHPKEGSFEFFSPEDIMYFASLAAVNIVDSGIAILNPTEITFTLTVDNQTFALQFDDNQAVTKLIDIYQDLKRQELFIRRLRRKYEGDINPMTGSTTNIGKQIHHVFNHLENYNLNISLYKANYSEDYIEDWEKLNENGSSTPCN